MDRVLFFQSYAIRVLAALIGPSVSHTCVGTGRAYLKFWPDTRGNRPVVVIRFANRFLPCSVLPLAVLVCPSSPDNQLEVGLKC